MGRAAEAIVASGGMFAPLVCMIAESRCGVHTGLIPDGVMTRVVTSKLDTLRSKVGQSTRRKTCHSSRVSELDIRWVP